MYTAPGVTLANETMGKILRDRDHAWSRWSPAMPPVLARDLARVLRRAGIAALAERSWSVYWQGRAAFMAEPSGRIIPPFASLTAASVASMAIAEALQAFEVPGVMVIRARPGRRWRRFLSRVARVFADHDAVLAVYTMGGAPAVADMLG